MPTGNSGSSGLMQIQPFIQACVLAVSSILDAAVTVVDSELVRVGGTAGYAGQIGKKINHSALFGKILRTGKPAFIRDVKKERHCKDCGNQDNCEELADLAYPIFLDGNVAGVIGIIAFKEPEKARILRDRDKLGEFLKYMSMLIESKLLTLQYSRELEHQIDEVVSLEKKQWEEAAFIGSGRVIRDILALARKISASDSTVLLSGESGTGKEIMARFIHNLSPRGKRLMISVNCGAIPENLAESELFGYEDGAFTGAKKGGHPGKFELANESTLFLDEIGEMPIRMQTRLLRVLQDGMVQRLGGKRAIPVNVRVICATNGDLKRQVEEGSFRNDLYYRLNVIPIALPPLRERREDIPLFVSHFIRRYSQQLKKSITGADDDALSAFLAYDWPGNVRELRNIIEYLVNIVEGDAIRAADLPDYFLAGVHRRPDGRSLKALTAEYEKLLLGRFAGAAPTAGEKRDLARSLGISNATLYRKLAEHRLI